MRLDKGKIDDKYNPEDGSEGRMIKKVIGNQQDGERAKSAGHTSGNAGYKNAKAD
jgi:hypothetical protein